MPVTARLLCLSAASFLTPALSPAAINEWTSLGPDGGFVNTLAIDPSMPSTIYAGTAGGGVFKSTDSGANWNPVNEGLTTRDVRGLAIDPAHSSTIYAATVTFGQGGGVFKSTDGGESWEEINAGLEQDLATKSVDAVIVDPVVTTTLYAVGNFSLYRSVDAGATWARLDGGIELSGPRAVAIDPRNGSTVYLATLFDGVFKSVDGGASWMAANIGLPARNVPILAVDSSNPQTLYVGTSDRGVFKSTDGGASWNAANEGISTFMVTALAIDPRTPPNVYAGASNGLFRSSDGGATWVFLVAFGGRPVPALALDPSRPSTLYAARSSDGVLKSDDAGSSWSMARLGLRALSVLALEVDPSHPSTILASTAAKGMFGRAGLFRSADAGATWQDVTAGLQTAEGYVPEVPALAIDPSNSSTVYAGTGSGVFKSADSGTTWTSINDGLPGTFGSPSPSVRSLAIDPASPVRVYAGIDRGVHLGGGVFKSLDGGASWSSAGLGSGAIVALAIDPRHTSTLFASESGLGGSFVYRTSDAGANWTLLPDLELKFVRDLAVNPVTSANIYAAAYDGVWKSSDGGTTWRLSSAGLTPEDPRFPFPDLRSLAVDPSNGSTLLAASYGGGVFRTANGARTWGAFNRGLSNLLDTVIAIDPSNPATVYVGTDGNGLFRVTVDEGPRSTRRPRLVDFRD